MVISVGVDVAEARKGLDVVALDDASAIVATMRRATPADVAAVVDELRADVVCIDSPSGWAPAGQRSRSGERALRAQGITCFSTPCDPGDHPFYRWMRAGFAVFDAVAPTHPVYRGGPPAGTAAEVFPEATAVLLAGHPRPADTTKVRFRRAVLDAQGIDAAALRSADQVDAALAALTGIRALAGRYTAPGDPAEGAILLPT